VHFSFNAHLTLKVRVNHPAELRTWLWLASHNQVWSNDETDLRSSDRPAFQLKVAATLTEERVIAPAAAAVTPLTKATMRDDDSGGMLEYRHVDSLAWAQAELAQGKIIKIRGYPKEHKVKLFRVAVSNNRTDWVMTNDLAQDSMDGTQKVCAIRWKIEQFHRELKQLTGVEKCQCRKARSQRNHIACAVLVWIRMTAIARKALTNIYSLKKGMLSHYMQQELQSQSVRMAMQG